jgi:hypothetical protein
MSQQAARKRNPIDKVIVLIRSEQQKELLANKISNLPVDCDRPIQIVISEQTKKRGLDQNGYYWLRLGEIAAQVWRNNKQYTSELWHDYCKKHEMQEEVELKDGTVCSKWIEAPDGSVTVISTTQLSKRCFAEYTQIVEAFGAGLGVMFSAIPRGN